MSYLKKTFCLAAVVGSANAFGVYLFSILNETMKGDLNFDHFFVGVASGLGQVAVICGSISAGVVLRRFDSLKILKALTLLLALTLLGMGATIHASPVLLFMPVMGFIASMSWIVASVVVRNEIELHHQGKSLGLIAATGTASMITLLALLLPVFLATAGWRAGWFAAAAICLVAFFLLQRHFRSEGTAEVQPDEDAKMRVPLANAIRSKIALIMAAMGVLNGLTYIPFQTYLVSYLQDKPGWTNAEAITSWTLIGLGSVVGGYLFGLLTDRTSAKFSLTLANLSTGLFILAVIEIDALVVVYLMLFGFGVAYGAIFGQTAAYIARSQPSEAGAWINGIMYLFFGLGSALGNFLVGALVAPWGGLQNQYYIIVTCLFVLAAIAAIILKRDRAFDGGPIKTAQSSGQS